MCAVPSLIHQRPKCHPTIWQVCTPYTIPSLFRWKLPENANYLSRHPPPYSWGISNVCGWLAGPARQRALRSVPADHRLLGAQLRDSDAKVPWAGDCWPCAHELRHALFFLFVIEAGPVFKAKHAQPQRTGRNQRVHQSRFQTVA